MNKALTLYFLFFETRHLTMSAASLENIIKLVLDDEEFLGVKSIAINDRGIPRIVWQR